MFGSFFAYNANFVWGFFNYYFASGLSFAITHDRRDNQIRIIESGSIGVRKRVAELAAFVN